MRCLKEDMATDSLVGAWVTIYWGLLGHPTGTAAVNAHGLRATMTKWCKVVQEVVKTSKSMQEHPRVLMTQD